MPGINKFYLLCVIFSGSPDLTFKTCLVPSALIPVTCNERLPVCDTSASCNNDDDDDDDDEMDSGDRRMNAHDTDPYKKIRNTTFTKSG